EFAASAADLHNPDFVDVSVHSYRHRYGLVDGDPAYEDTERALATAPAITVPTVVVDPTEDTVAALYGRPDHAAHVTDLRAVREVACGHNPPQELPGQFVDAIRILTA
ncbi:MAG: alpha/beta hydrolase, partial [Williamsia herbipolensis]|nr:alpha/beta hydrolase [Williamsia herbipolensis]